MSPDETQSTEPAPAAEMIMPKRQLVIQPLSDFVVPDAKKEDAASANWEQPAVPLSYTEAAAQAEQIKQMSAQTKQKKPAKFVPNPELLPPVVEKHDGLILLSIVLVILGGGGAAAWYYLNK